MSLTFDPYDLVSTDPYPVYAEMRRRAPVVELAERGIWVLSRYHDVVAAARDPQTFSSADANGVRRRRVPTLVGVDPPDHTRLRRTVAPLFISRVVGDRLQQLDSFAAERVGDLVEAGGGDVVDAIASPVANGVIARMLGVDPVDLDRMRRVAAARPDRIRVYSSFFSRCIADRRTEPGDDIVTDLLTDTGRGDVMSDEEIVAFCTLMLSAGLDTSRDLIANLILRLAEHPEAWRRVLDDKIARGAAIDETLRHASPIQGMYRTTTRRVVVAGREVPSDARVLLLFGSANRDETVWEASELFRVDRHLAPERESPHVGFGTGPHVCIGASLARRIASSVLDALVDDVERMRLDGAPRLVPNPCFRTLTSLGVSVRQVSRRFMRRSRTSTSQTKKELS